MRVDTLSEFFDQFGWRAHWRDDQKGQREGFVAAHWSKGAADDSFTVYVDPFVEREVLIFTVPKLAFVPSNLKDVARLTVLHLLAEANNRLLFGTYAYDSKDGEVCFRMVVPVMDSEFTYRQFDVCMRACINAAEACGSSVFGALNQEGPKVAATAPDAETEELFKQFEQFLKERKDRATPDGG